MSRLVALDRDGTVIEERPYLSHRRDVRLLPNAARAIRELRSLGLPVVLVSNQAGIGYGYFNLETLDRIHERLFQLLVAEETGVDGVYFCPHKPGDGCGCRKPDVGLLERAARDFGLRPQDAFVVGDKECDIEMGRRAGATTLLVRTGCGQETAAEAKLRPHFEVDDLLAATQVIARLATADLGLKAGGG